MRFCDTYLSEPVSTVVEIGSQIVLGQHSMRRVFSAASSYVGVDFVSGEGVDIVADDPYLLPLYDRTAECVVSSSCFEHAEFFWLSFLEMCRIAKEDSLTYLSAPSNGKIHRYPVDCWRFYPDSGLALQKWAQPNGYDITLLESFILYQVEDVWNDFVAVFATGKYASEGFTPRMISGLSDFTNGIVNTESKLLHATSLSEDMARKLAIEQVSSGAISLTWPSAVEGGADVNP
jgi:hypothetical protein